MTEKINKKIKKKSNKKATHKKQAKTKKVAVKQAGDERAQYVGTSVVAPSAAQRAQRQAYLKQVAVELKQELFGIDDIIDQVLHAIRAWYVWPEVITRPVIVPLWGLTGTGKTQLVRSLVQKLGFYDRFVEVQMDGFSNGGQWRKTISGMLADSQVLEGEPGVLLLDEFQRYRTKDAKGQDVKVERYQDVWTLLSDGKLSPKLSFLKSLEYKLADLHYDHERTSKGERKSAQKKKFKLDAWDARDLKEALKLKESLLEIMRWSLDEVRQRMEQLRHTQQRWETDYSKLLVFVTGNLDEMYSNLAERVEDCDTDADVFYSMTRKLSVIDVKKALAERFRPEQIARLGNGHIVYPSLTKHAYQQLIERTSQQYLDEVAASSGVRFTLSDVVMDELYANAVFPAQGTRPVFSGVHHALSSMLVNAALWVLDTSTELSNTDSGVELPKRALRIDLDAKRAHFVLRYKRRVHRLPAKFEINTLRRRSSEDFRTLLAVHEAGHGLVYGLLRGHPPQEMRINVASFTGGYNSYVKHKAYSKRMWLDFICVSLAGRVAEAWVFGDDATTTGAYEDYKKATASAAKFIREFGFGNRMSHTDVCTDMDEHVNTDVEPTNAQIEELLQAQYSRADAVLRAHKSNFNKLVTQLLAQGSVSPSEFADMFGLEQKKPMEDAIEPYAKAWEVFQSEA